MTPPLLAAHNSERERRGMKLLSESPVLTRVAQKHAEDMADRGRVFHGDTYSRIYKSGYRYSAAGENVAGGQPSILSVMTDWMSSPGHRQNILSNKFTEAGFGAAADDSGITYWVAVFARPVIGGNDVADDVVVGSDDGLFRIPPVIIGPQADALPLSGEVNWGMAAFGIDKLRSVSDGKGMICGIVDTGADRTHPLLSNCIAAKDFTGSRIGSGDSNGHGSHVTGTVGAQDPRIGVAPGCKTVHGKGLSDGGSGAGTWIAAAMRWCAEQGAEVISMSLGSSSEDPRITAALKELADAGIWVVAAGGNSGVNTPDVDWPGRSPHCLSVAALDASMKPASFSNSGAKIDTSGPGVMIWSVRPGGGFAQMSGTSMATPFVAGMLTLFRSALKLANRPIPNVYDMRALLSRRSTDVGTPGDDRRSGPGFANPLLLELAVVPDPPPVV